MKDSIILYRLKQVFDYLQDVEICHKIDLLLQLTLLDLTQLSEVEIKLLEHKIFHFLILVTIYRNHKLCDLKS